jgi:two-component system CheB/CheR fusion protein
LIPADIGRPIGHIKPNIECPDLEALIRQVIDSVTPCERDVRDRQGNSFWLRIRPYKDLENRIDGAVLTLYDSQAKEQNAVALQRGMSLASRVIQAAHQPMLLLDADLRIDQLNGAFAEHFAIPAREAVGRKLFEIGSGWNGEDLRNLLANVSLSMKVESVEIEPNLGRRGRRRLRVTACRLGSESETLLIAVGIEEIGSVK